MKTGVFAILGALIACSVRQAPPPLGISIDGALGFDIGSTLSAAREVASRHGDQLTCRTHQDTQFCTPQRIPGERGYYTVVLTADTVRSITFQLRSWPESPLPIIESELERIAVLRAAGPMSDEGRGYIRIWTNATWTRQIITLCDHATDTDCDLSVAEAEPDIVRRRADRILARQEPVDSVL